MPGIKRPSARIEGDKRALEALAAIGTEARTSRRRRGLSQLEIAARVGVSRAYVAKIEAGLARGVPLAVLFTLGEALGRPLRAELLRDRLDVPADAGHLRIQELVLRLARPAGYEGSFELATRPSDPSRSSDVVLVD